MALGDQGVACSLSCSLSNRRQKKHDVFLSFRGEDTRKKFTDHLYAALCLNELITFRDEEELGRGEVIRPTLLQAIEESLSAIVILSKNYATSTWCLDELRKILDSKRALCLHVFPIFYEVDLSDVRHQRGSFEEAFVKHEQKFAHDKVQRWRDALKEVADISGWNSQDYRYETKLIEEVAETVRSKIDEQPPLDSNVEGDDDGLIGMDEKIADFDSVLANTSEEVQFIGIWGMGGLGKTTLARTVYERIHRNYEVHFFLHNVREESAKDSGLFSLQKKLLSHSKKSIRMDVGDCYEQRKLIKRTLHNTKVLLVLDDVSDISQLENLAGQEGWFGKGSRIIITTRDQHVLLLHGVVSQYKMNFLSHNESLQLFTQIAFKGDQPNENYLELSSRAIKSAQNLPLAIKVFGSFLCGRSIPEWENALKKIPSDGIFDILKVSFDGLRCNEKNIFLDIACFFNGLAKDDVIQILENCDLQPIIGIRTLIEKSLVTETDEGCLRVHDRLQEMGKEIVLHESPNDVGKRSRIWSFEDANLVLRNKRGTGAIRGIVVRFDKPHVIYLDPEAFSNMSNLKLLIMSHSSRDQLNLLRGLKCLSNSLKVIDWKEYPLDFLPSQTPLDELVDLKMLHSKLKELWRGDQFLQTLKFVDLSHSKNLIRTPNFDKTPNLQRLILEGCIKLVEVHHSLGQHKCLVIVDLKGCKSIKTLPTKLEMNCLETLVLSGCSKVKKLPEFGEGMERLSMLDLEGTAISKLPQSLVNLIGRATLNLKDCKDLVCLPSDFQKLKSIKKINIRGCSKFSSLPENLSENEALEELDVGGTTITEVPSFLNNLKVLDLSGSNSYAQPSSSWNHYSLLKRAFRLQRPSSSTKFMWSPSFSNLSPSLVQLYLDYCNLHDESLLNGIGNLSSLTTLGLCGNNFVEIPSGLISKLQKVEYIGLNDCPRLQSLPQLPKNLSMIQASDCPSLNYDASPQQLWGLVEKFECQTRRQSEVPYGDGLIFYLLSDGTFILTTPNNPRDDFLLQPTRTLIISGGEVPSWFHNQSYFWVQDFAVPTNVSFIVNKPDSCRSNEWWGIAVCLVLEKDLKSAKFDDLYGGFCWTYSRYSIPFRACSFPWQSKCHHQRCIIYIRFSSSFVAEQPLQMVFFPMPGWKIEQCGWRVLYKEDVERWQNTSDEGCSVSIDDKFIDEYDDGEASAFQARGKVETTARH